MDVDDILEAKYEIKKLLEKKGYNNSSFLREYNKTLEKPMSSQNFSNRLSGGYLKYIEVKKIAEFLGYKIKFEEK